MNGREPQPSGAARRIAFTAAAVVVCAALLPWTHTSPLYPYLATLAIALAGVAFILHIRHAATARRALAAAQEDYRWLFEESFAGMFAYRDNIILFANTRFAHMLGYRPDQIIGRSIWDIIHADDHPAVRDRLRNRERIGHPDLHYELRFIRSDGTTVWTDLASTITTRQGAPAILVNTFDITERKEAERRQRELTDLTRRQEEQLVHSTRLAELGEMAAAVAHELNQPLTGIRTYARNALYMIEQEQGTTDDIAENLGLIAAQTDRAAKIIGRMRQLARKSDRHLAHIDINQVLRDTIEFLTPQLQLAAITTHLDLAPTLPLTHGDRLRLEQVLLNLLTNARQAMDATPTRTLTIRTTHHPADRRPIHVEITDTGKGFDPAHADKLFTPFYTTKPPGHGTGLGLSISHSIITDHHGTLTATTPPNGGATFTIHLPVAPHSDPTAPETHNDIPHIT